MIRVLAIIILYGLLGCEEYQNQKKKPGSETVTLELFKEIEFTSLNTTLRGRLYLPDNKSKNNPVVIMAHGFTTLINGMTADKYAEKLRESGFAVILYDHRNFGLVMGNLDKK